MAHNGEVLIIDEFTGRVMPGRRYSDGLHGALEAKNTTIQRKVKHLQPLLSKTSSVCTKLFRYDWYS